MGAMLFYYKGKNAMAVDRLVKDDIEYFETAEEVAREEDRVELDIHLLGWTKKFRIRALSFEQMEKINKLATITETDKKTGRIAGQMDHAEWVYWTIAEGVVRPYFSIAKARALSDNNGEFVRELADEIWNLARISQRMWNAYIDEQRRLAEIEKTGNPDAGDTDESDEFSD